VLDPFCGSGTTLVECCHLQLRGFGTDINPLAVFVANAKLQVLATPADTLRRLLGRLSSRIGRTRRWQRPIQSDGRGAYLGAWFDPSVLEVIETVFAKIVDTAEEFSPFYLAIASNLLREYSQQDPNDLRIRRRKSPPPSMPFQAAFLRACNQALDRLEATQSVLGESMPIGEARLCDVTKLSGKDVLGRFDAAITSPPYAMALPYIDTQRLSLVWLRLIEPERIHDLEAELVGSREIRGTSRKQLLGELLDNEASLPEQEVRACLMLRNALGSHDGFRRQAVPSLLYRYLAGMQKSFQSVRKVMKPGAKFALVVGHNHTVLSGQRHDIDTPAHLSSLAANAGWILEESIPLQTYRRYGYHAGNAIGGETLLILRRGVGE
jgi:site-specific DNA-methyltransferase (cytosine-N4-specific)